MRDTSRTKTGATCPALRVLDLPGLFLAAFALLAVAAVQVVPAGMVFFAAMLLIPGVPLSQRPQPALYTAIWNRAAIGFVGAMVLFQFVSSQPPHAVLVYICIFLLMLRWFNPRGLREHVESWALTALLSMIGALEGSGLLGIVLLLGWATATLHLFHLLAVLRVHPGVERAKSPLTWSLAPQTFRALPALLFGAFAVSVLMVLVIPRAERPTAALGGGHSPSPEEPSVTRTGFSESISLSGLSSIHGSEGIAFRISDPPAAMDPARLRLRVSTLDDFDGWRWRRSVDDWKGSEELARPVTPPLFSLTAEPEEGSGLRWLQIRRVDFRSNALAIPEGAVMIGGLASDAALTIRADGRVESGHSRPPQSYQVWARRLGPEEGNPAHVGDQTLPTHLTIPADLREPVAFAARQILPAEGSVAEIAEQVRSHFRRHGIYSLNLQHLPEGPEAVAGFLHRPEGHCEMFATAMALVLRHGGIPTRLVTGFVGAMPVPSPGGGLVREWVVPHKSAHAWVEVWLGDRWAAYDPTPTSAIGGAALSPVAGGLREQLRRQSDHLASFVEGYDHAAQRRLLRSLQSGSLSLIASVEDGALLRMGARFGRNIREPELLGLLALLLLVNLTIFSVYLRSHQLRRLLKLPAPQVPSRNRPRIPQLLRDLLMALQAPADMPEAGQPLATDRIHRAMELAGLPAGKADRLAALYNEWRFGGGDAAVERRLRSEIHSLKASIRGRRWGASPARADGGNNA